MIFNQRVVALVPMKGHSERVPGKNVRPFSGRPLFHHILNTLEQTYAVDEVVVNTDSERIAEEAAGSLFPKVRVLRRPAELCGDLVSMNSIIAHDIEQAPADIYVQTHATNPLLRSKTIGEALRLFIEQDCDSLFSVNRIQTRLYDSGGRPVNHDPDELVRTQDLEPVFEENSALYVFTRRSFEAAGRRIGIHPFMFETDRIESIDIDDDYTFRLAEMLVAYTLR